MEYAYHCQLTIIDQLLNQLIFKTYIITYKLIYHEFHEKHENNLKYSANLTDLQIPAEWPAEPTIHPSQSPLASSNGAALRRIQACAGEPFGRALAGAGATAVQGQLQPGDGRVVATASLVNLRLWGVG